MTTFEIILAIAILVLAVLGLIVFLVRWRTETLDFLNGSYGWWGRLSPFAKHLTLAIHLTILVFLVSWLAGWYAESYSRTWLCEYDPDIYQDCPALMAASLTSAAPTETPAPTLPRVASRAEVENDLVQQQAQETPSSTPSPQATPTPTPSPVATPIPLTEEEENRIATQAQKVKGLKRHHASVMAFFTKAYYTAICVMLVAGAISAACMFVIATRSWGNTNPYVRTMFLVMAASVAFCGLWPPVFQHEKNLSENKALFLQYVTLQNEIESYPITRSSLNEKKAPVDFVNYVDKEMARLGNIAVGFDHSKITYKGAFETSNTSTPTPPPVATPTKKPGT